MQRRRRTALLRTLVLVGLAFAASGCRGARIRELEQRVEQLETRIANLEGRAGVPSPP